jgi:hypothetical protein
VTRQRDSGVEICAFLNCPRVLGLWAWVFHAWLPAKQRAWAHSLGRFDRGDFVEIHASINPEEDTWALACLLNVYMKLTTKPLQFLTGGFNEKAVMTQVTNGKGAMPAFGGRLSDDDIANVAAFVIESSTEGW